MTETIPALPKALMLVNGPNLNLLGERDPAQYGTTTLQQIEEMLKAVAVQKGFSLQCVQSNSEGQLIDTIQEARKTTQGMLINPGAYAHTSVALQDAVGDYPSPVIEVHLSNIYKREAFRHHSYISAVVNGVICGLGQKGYTIGLEALIHLVNNKNER